MITRKIPFRRLFQLGEEMPPTSKNTFLEIHINTNTATPFAQTRTFLPMVVCKGLSLFLLSLTLSQHEALANFVCRFFLGSQNWVFANVGCRSLSFTLAIPAAAVADVTIAQKKNLRAKTPLPCCSQQSMYQTRQFATCIRKNFWAILLSAAIFLMCSFFFSSTSFLQRRFLQNGAKLLTTMGMGRVRMKTPERAQKPPMIFPGKLDQSHC